MLALDCEKLPGFLGIITDGSDAISAEVVETDTKEDNADETKTDDAKEGGTNVDDDLL